MTVLGVAGTDYTGYKIVSVNDSSVVDFYASKDRTINWFDLLENQYVVFMDNGEPVDKYKWQDGRLKGLCRKPLESIAVGTVKAKNYQQEMAIDALMDTSTTVKVLSGIQGSGKTYLLAASAMHMALSGVYERIVWIRNNIEVKNTNKIGALPGTAYEKLLPFAMPLADHVGGRQALDMYVNRGTIEVESLSFLRGRDFKKSIIMCSESEQLTTDHVALLLTRCAEGSIIMFDGDWRPVDARVFEQDNGLVTMINKLKGQRLFSYVNLPESVRSDTARMADLLYH